MESCRSVLHAVYPDDLNKAQEKHVNNPLPINQWKPNPTSYDNLNIPTNEFLPA